MLQTIEVSNTSRVIGSLLTNDEFGGSLGESHRPSGSWTKAVSTPSLELSSSYQRASISNSSYCILPFRVTNVVA